MDKLSEHLFPTQKQHLVFLSHYHPQSDEEESQLCYLQQEIKARTGLNTFVDGQHWGSADKTITQVLNIYYNYAPPFPLDESLKIIRAVDMALQRALRKQTEQSSYFIFLDKHHNLKTRAIIKAYSPWVALEVEAAPHLVKKRSQLMTHSGVVAFSEEKKSIPIPVYEISWNTAPNAIIINKMAELWDYLSPNVNE